MKKLFTLLLSLAMLVSLAVPAFATELEGAYTQEEINAINEVNIAKYAKVLLMRSVMIQTLNQGMFSLSIVRMTKSPDIV